MRTEKSHLRFTTTSALLFLCCTVGCFLVCHVCADEARAPVVDSVLRSHHEAVPPDPDDHTASTDDVVFSKIHHGPTASTSTRNGNGGGEHGHGETGEVQRFRVAKVDFHHVATPFIISVWIIIAGFAKIGFHVTPKLHLICPESCILIVIGVIIGLLLFYTGLTSVGPLTPEVFFLFMLPPIVLDAGYYMPNRSFFDNLGAILTYAVIGTVWNALTIGLSLWGVGQTGLYGIKVPLLDTLLFSSIIVAVDPVAVLAVFEEIHVNDVLYILVFGESLLNDAVTVVLYRMFEGYTDMGQENIIPTDYVAGVASFFVVAIGGTAMGIVWGLIAAFISRFTHHVRTIEPLFVFVLGYLSYLSAELFHLSGILALTFCGITMKNYVEENVSNKSHTTMKYGMKMVANCSETIIFMFLGVTTVNDIHEWNTWFVVLTIVFITVFRALGVILLTWPLNRFRVHPLNKVDQFIMAYGGLRGAVAFALVLVVNEDVIPTKRMLVTTTIAVIYFTVFIQGMTIGPLVRLLNVPRSVKTQLSMNERIHTRLMDHLMAGMEDITGQFMGNYKIRDKFKYYNNKFIRPFLLKDSSIREPKIIQTYSKLNLADAMNIMKHNSSMVPVMTKENGMSLASLFRTYTQTNLNMFQNDDSPQVKSAIPMNNSTTVLNFDMNELEYSPKDKDYVDAELHHILADSMFAPARNKVKRNVSKYDENSPSHPPFHHQMRMQIRTFLSEERRRKKGKGQSKQKNNDPNHTNNKAQCKHQEVNRKISSGDKPQLRFNLPADTLNIDSHHLSPYTSYTDYNYNVNQEDEEGITFTARPDRNPSPAQDGHQESRSYSPPPPPEDLTETETTLPWKRDEVYEATNGALRQQEFPSWIENREYIAYQSPTSTILGRLDKNRKKPPDVFEIFELNGKQQGQRRPSQSAPRTIEDVEEEDGSGSDSGRGLSRDASFKNHSLPNAMTLPAHRTSSIDHNSQNNQQSQDGAIRTRDNTIQDEQNKQVVIDVNGDSDDSHHVRL